MSLNNAVYRVFISRNILVPSAFAPKIPKSTPFMVRSFMGGGIFYNMSAKKRNVENKWLYILSTFQKTFIKKIIIK